MTTIALLSVCAREYASENDQDDQLRNAEAFATVAGAKRHAEDETGAETPLAWHDGPNGESWAEDDADNRWLIRVVTLGA